MKRRLWILGSGGHAKVIIEAIRCSDEFEIAGCLDDDPARHGESVLGVPILGDTTDQSLDHLGVDLGVIAVGSNRGRASISARLDGRIEWASVVHPAAWVAASAALGAGTVVMAGAIVQPNAIVGDHVILNTGCSVDHDCHVGNCVHVAPGARVTGGVHIGEGAFLGAGAVVIPSVSIGAWSVVGAGAAAIRDVAPHAVVAGVPAEPIGPTSQ